MGNDDTPGGPCDGTPGVQGMVPWMLRDVSSLASSGNSQARR